ncbi:hypothetical protein MY11210_005225 [Beauveria gryllotalpidicola]
MLAAASRKAPAAAAGGIVRRSIVRAAAQRRCLATEALSIRTGPSEPPLYKGTIPEHFASTVSQHGDRPAVIARSPARAASHETALSYYELDLLSNRLASSLTSLGVTKGDRIAVSLGNGAEFAALTYALFKLGAVLVPLNPSFNASQVAAALRHLAVQVLVVGAVTDIAYRPCRGRSNEPLLAELAGGDLRGGAIANPDVPSLQKILVVDNRTSHPDVRFDLDACRRVLTPYWNLLDGADRPVKPAAPLLPSDTINIQFTSGTTSVPKAAQLTHTGILNNGILIADRMGLDATDRIVVPPPLFHCFGSVLGYMATATTGAAILFPSPAFDPVAALRMCVDHDATGLYGVTTMIVAVLEALESGPAAGTPPQHLRKGIVAGSSVPESLMRKIYDALGLQDLVICYGMTETSPVSCMTRPSDALHLRCASVGAPMPHTSVKIVDPLDRARILPLGERGELAAAGYLVMEGYYGDPARTAEVRVADDAGTVWVYSGDEAEMDADGYVRITGRIKDLIIRGGENIHPLEIEDCLFRMPGVQEASVVGLPDDKLGECVAAFVVPKQEWTVEGGTNSNGAAAQTARTEGSSKQQHVLTRDAVRDWVRTRLSSHLVPKYIFWVDEYPKTASGKIQKFKLQEQAKTLLQEQ